MVLSEESAILRYRHVLFRGEQAGWDEETNEAWLWLVNLITRIQHESVDIDITEVDQNMPVADDKGAFEELQTLLKENNELATTITKLQEKLSVSYAKEAKMQNKVLNLTNSIRKLTEETKKLQSLESKV